jgi:transcriptional regulator with XRE-family HTH domain
MPIDYRSSDAHASGFPINGFPTLFTMKRERVRTDFGQRLFDARKGARLTQSALAKLVGMGQSTLTEAETIAHGSSYTAQLAQATGVRAEWLAAGTGAMYPPKPAKAVTAEPTTRPGVLSEAEHLLLQNFRDLPDPDQAELAAEIEARAEKARGYIQKVLRGQAALAALQTHTPEQGYSSQPHRKPSAMETFEARLDEAAKNGESNKNRRGGAKGNARRRR